MQESNKAIPTYIFLMAELVGTLESMITFLPPERKFIKQQVEERVNFLRSITIHQIDTDWITTELEAAKLIKPLKTKTK